MIAVIGGGLQGACVALELALRDRKVVLFEENDIPMDEASRWNEGKLHLGFVYANDPTLTTARAMIEGSLSFIPNLERVLGVKLSNYIAHSPFVYGIMRDSMIPTVAAETHFKAIEQLVFDRGPDWWQQYGMSTAPSALREIPVEECFDGSRIIKAFRTPEIAVNTHEIADLVTKRLANESKVEMRLGSRIDAVLQTGKGYHLQLGDGRIEGSFTNVVNCSWRSLLAIDASLGHQPPRSWLHRYKAAIRLRTAKPISDIPCCTFVLGPYGDIVNMGDGTFYLSWYPVCRLETSQDLAPSHSPEPIQLNEQERLTALTLQNLNERVPKIARLRDNYETTVKGGWIFAWAQTDITDANSRLHTRHEVGPWRDGGYFSINTGKYCMAPKFGAEVARTLGGS